MTDQNAAPGKSGSGLDPKLAALLCYLCTPITGIIFLLIEKNDKSVKFHAWHSIVFGGAWIAFMIVAQVLSAILFNISIWLAGAFGIVTLLVELVFFILWIVLMVKAYQGAVFNVPVITDLARKQAEK